MADVEGRKLWLLNSPAFLLALCLLLLNDFVLKRAFDNWLTGKLSDFAGLFVFPLFWAALFPRFRRAVYLLTAGAFLFWKSAHSRPLIEAWNRLGVLPLGRTVDASDLLALLVLPVSFLYSARGVVRPARRLAPYLVAAASLFAFTATSYRTNFTYENRYPFEMSQAELTRKVFNLPRADAKYRVAPCDPARGGAGDIEVTIPSDFCFDSVTADIAVGAEQGRGLITLKRMEHHCPEGWRDKAKLLDIFEKNFIESLARSSAVFPADELPELPPARADAPGRLYLVPLGEPRGVDMRELAEHLRRASGAQVRLLPGLALGSETRDPRFPASRPQAELLLGLMRAEHPRLSADAGAVLIGVAQDFYSKAERSPSHYVEAGRLAVVSLDGLNPATFCEPPDEELLRSRLRKVMAGLYSQAPARPAR